MFAVLCTLKVTIEFIIIIKKDLLQSCIKRDMDQNSMEDQEVPRHVSQIIIMIFHIWPRLMSSIILSKTIHLLKKLTKDINPNLKNSRKQWVNTVNATPS